VKTPLPFLVNVPFPVPRPSNVVQGMSVRCTVSVGSGPMKSSARKWQIRFVFSAGVPTSIDWSVVTATIGGTTTKQRKSFVSVAPSPSAEAGQR
jgi:hypothetical protein